MPFQAVGDDGKGVAIISGDPGPVQIKEIVVRGVDTLAVIDDPVHLPEQGRVDGLKVPAAEEQRCPVVSVV